MPGDAVSTFEIILLILAGVIALRQLVLLFRGQ